MCGCLSGAPTGDLAYNPGMCPDWESNQSPFDLQASTQAQSHTSQGFLPSFFLPYSRLVQGENLTPTYPPLVIRDSPRAPSTSDPCVCHSGPACTMLCLPTGHILCK